mmetsp:Transcript_16682/g.26461  ORF Transcript_16682/g.26461 Transcript_16682/m.26461 type:complete len:222 (-) Transcript_16682:509-1174(-)
MSPMLRDTPTPGMPFIFLISLCISFDGVFEFFSFVPLRDPLCMPSPSPLGVALAIALSLPPLSALVTPPALLPPTTGINSTLDDSSGISFSEDLAKSTLAALDMRFRSRSPIPKEPQTDGLIEFLCFCFLVECMAKRMLLDLTTFPIFISIMSFWDLSCDPPSRITRTKSSTVMLPFLASSRIFHKCLKLRFDMLSYSPFLRIQYLSFLGVIIPSPSTSIW